MKLNAASSLPHGCHPQHAFAPSPPRLQAIARGMEGIARVQQRAISVAEAKAAGYTEPDHSDDLAGMDVARKVTILAR